MYMLLVCDFKSGLEGSVTVTYMHWVTSFSVMVAREVLSFEAVHESVVYK